MNNILNERKYKLLAIAACILIAAAVLSACYNGGESDAAGGIETTENAEEANASARFSYEYGVFLAAEPEDIDAMKEYRSVVIDAQEFSREDISRMHEMGQTVYSYINIGSVEKFRDYYSKYEDITLGVYENWEDESWVDVSSGRWQKFISEVLAAELESKGVDGFFVDNADVYYQYPSSKIYGGVCDILKSLRSTGKDVILNGGDTFISRYLKDGGVLTDVITAVNQESVITSIDWENEFFELNSDEDRSYFEECIDRVAKSGGKVYMLEYTDDDEVIRTIDEFARNRGYVWYAADSLELTAGGGTGMGI